MVVALAVAVLPLRCTAPDPSKLPLLRQVLYHPSLVARKLLFSPVLFLFLRQVLYHPSLVARKLLFSPVLFLFV